MNCEHITDCLICEDLICSYCVEDCSGCSNNFCNPCYECHQVTCKDCETKLCPLEIKGEICPICEMKDGTT